jgi:hypothetical protein
MADEAIMVRMGSPLFWNGPVGERSTAGDRSCRRRSFRFDAR